MAEPLLQAFAMAEPLFKPLSLTESFHPLTWRRWRPGYMAHPPLWGKEDLMVMVMIIIRIMVMIMVIMFMANPALWGKEDLMVMVMVIIRIMVIIMAIMFNCSWPTQPSEGKKIVPQTISSKIFTQCTVFKWLKPILVFSFPFRLFLCVENKFSFDTVGSLIYGLWHKIYQIKFGRVRNKRGTIPFSFLSSSFTNHHHKQQHCCRHPLHLHLENKGIGDAGSTTDFRMLWSAIVCVGLL